MLQDAPVDEEARFYSIEDYLARLMAARNSLYGPYHEDSYAEVMVPDLARDRKRSPSRAENNFQLRVRKRGQSFSPKPMAESNFQLRVRKDLLDRYRSVPQIRSSAAESNFQLRVRKSYPMAAENNFQLRVRKPYPMAAENNFQLRVRKSDSSMEDDSDNG